MTEADVESDSAILGSLAGILSEDADVAHKSKSMNTSNTKKNTRGGPKGKEVKHDLRSKKDATVSNDKTKGGSIVTNNNESVQDKGLSSHGVEDHSDVRENDKRGTNSIRSPSPKPGGSQDGYYRGDSPNRNPRVV